MRNKQQYALLMTCILGFMCLTFSPEKIYKFESKVKPTQNILKTAKAISRNISSTNLVKQVDPFTPAEDIKQYEAAAARGDSDAQILLAFMYLEGKGIRQDEVRGAEWMRAAADNGNRDAEYFLGELYFDGRGVETNLVKARQLFYKSADLGNITAMYSIGKMYLDGIGGEQNIDVAINWFRTAGLSGSKISQNILGEIFRDGIGVSQDYVQAYAWCALAAKSGFKKSKNSLPEIAALMSDSQITEAKRLLEKLEKI